jgi:hypothetical protein
VPSNAAGEASVESDMANRINNPYDPLRAHDLTVVDGAVVVPESDSK